MSKQPWEAETFEELELLLEPLLNGETPIGYVTRILNMRHRQRQGDLRRNVERRAILNYIKDHPELKKKALRS